MSGKAAYGCSWATAAFVTGQEDAKWPSVLPGSVPHCRVFTCSQEVHKK